jgi:hypothetical protein
VLSPEVEAWSPKEVVLLRWLGAVASQISVRSLLSSVISLA